HADRYLPVLLHGPAAGVGKTEHAGNAPNEAVCNLNRACLFLLRVWVTNRKKSLIHHKTFTYVESIIHVNQHKKKMKDELIALTSVSATGGKATKKVMDKLFDSSQWEECTAFNYNHIYFDNWCSEDG